MGTVRVGVAVSDPDGLVATPLATLPAGPGLLAQVSSVVADVEPITVYLGLPRTLRGAEGASALMVRTLATTLAGAIAPVPVRLVDERFTTTTAQRALAAAGVRARDSRAVIDQAAAVAILEAALATEAAQDTEAGELVLATVVDDVGQVQGPADRGSSEGVRQ